MYILRYLPLLSTVVTFAFAWAVFARYRRRKGLHLLLWGIGLILYAMGTLSEAILAFRFSGPVIKLWYLSGAMLTAAWLGQGSVHLLVRRRGVASALTGVLTAVSVLAIALVLAAPLISTNYVLSRPVSGQYRQILSRSGLTIFLTILLNIYGSLGLIGGAIWSAWLFYRKQVLPGRVIGNVLIAAGALMPAMAGSLIKAGLADWLYLSELLGAILMFIGFVQATAHQPVERLAPAASSAD
ncbi:MAG: hypothetical protein HY784_10930 [Chloroflexi bacterium]|nr:hypothetical protein [Chloroflexota bacterium]